MEALAQSLKEGEVDYILVDRYIPKKRNDLFNGSWFEVVALLRCELYHGAVLQGEALKLAPVLKEMIDYDNVQTKFLEDDEPAEEVSILHINGSYMIHFIYHFIVDSFLAGTLEPTNDELPTLVAS